MDIRYLPLSGNYIVHIENEEDQTYITNLKRLDDVMKVLGVDQALRILEQHAHMMKKPTDDRLDNALIRLNNAMMDTNETSLGTHVMTHPMQSLDDDKVPPSDFQSIVDETFGSTDDDNLPDEGPTGNLY